MQMAPFRTAIFSGIVIVGGFTLASLAFADGAKSGTADAEFMKMDTDKDGFLTKDEFVAGHASMIKKPSR
jgi:hypothetical protein